MPDKKEEWLIKFLKKEVNITMLDIMNKIPGGVSGFGGEMSGHVEFNLFVRQLRQQGKIKREGDFFVLSDNVPLDGFNSNPDQVSMF